MPPNPSQDIASSPQQRQAVWTHHWSSGVLHSCAEHPDGRLGSGFVEFWRPLIQALPEETALLELGSGNGVLPWSMVAWRRPLKLQIDAVDWADVRPPWLASLDADQRSRIRIHGGVRMEALPFPAASFDLVIGQYALEYGELAACAAEIRRVAKPGAEVALVCHHSDSRPVRLARTELSHMALLLEEPAGLLVCAQRLLPWVRMAQPPEGRARLASLPDANRDRTAFNDAQTRLSAAANGSDCPDVIEEARSVVDAALRAAADGQVESGQANIERWAAALRGAQLRLQELSACALDAEATQRLSTLLDLVQPAAWTPLLDQGHCMAWCLRGRLRR